MLQGEVANRVVAPVIALALVDQMAVVNETVDRHQFDRGDAKVLEVLDHRCGGEAGISTAQGSWHFRVLERETAHMQLVDHHFVPGNIG